ncbi:GIY-YIG nuclease family protein [Candidatus Parcubacteria bacterium]|jgi:putative endonuclease|nr:GIY-YIG nuclease family protein [Candidatus Parcubacteria bacterium]MBT3948635.1 GIY-YIG nuclease family protein [Candidatus Parcubacteria bacterium]
MYTLYIIKCSDESLYTGIATDLNKRLDIHKQGTGSKYVRTRLPFSLVYTEKCKNRSLATKREMVIKKLTRKQKLNLIKK